jgi:predicted nuclease of predicted toxin-antitoxin system
VRIKLDENLPAALVPLLAALGHDVDTAPAEGIAGEDDGVVWRAAQADGRLLVTQDLDFSDARKYAPGTHHGLAAGSATAAWSNRIAGQGRESVSD